MPHGSAEWQNAQNRSAEVLNSITNPGTIASSPTPARASAIAVRLDMASSSTQDASQIFDQSERKQSSQLPKRRSRASSDSSQRRPKAPPAFHFLAGLVTGSLSALLLQPADLLKTRVQQRRGASLRTTLREILSQPGVVRQLWRGTLPSVIRTGLGSALYFCSLSTLRSSWAKLQSEERTWRTAKSTTYRGSDMRKELGKVADLAPDKTELALDGTIEVHDPLAQRTKFGSRQDTIVATKTSPASASAPKFSNTANLVMGGLARGGAGLIMMPITVLKVRYESSLYASYGSSVGVIGAARGIVAHEGWRGLYSGYGATLIRDAPHAGLYVLFYEQVKSTLNSLTSSSATTGNSAPGNASSVQSSAARANSINFVSGIIAAAGATAVTNPFDAIKTRLQLMPDRYYNMPTAAAAMLREEGPRAFLDGLGLRMVRKAMSSALAWTIYEDLVRRAETRYAALENNRLA